MQEYKICVYAICKNEEKFAERWYRSVAEADWVVVLDTGSTDRSVEVLRELGATVRQQQIIPWRFDAARNASMELIPPEADICLCVDLDEVLQPGWRTWVQQSWRPEAMQGAYRYVWNFNPDGSEGTVFTAEKMHANGAFRWINPVHEILQYTGDRPYVRVAIDGMQIDHHADDHKSRGQYLPLLELAVQEDPTNDRNMHYLGREYMFHGRWEEAIRTLQRHLELPNATWAAERCASMRFISRCYQRKGDWKKGESWLFAAIAQAPELREPYLEMAWLLYTQKQWEGVIYMCQCALAIQQRPLDYISEAVCWGSRPYDLAAMAYYYIGQYGPALQMARKALALEPADARLQNNVLEMEKRVQNNSGTGEAARR